MKDSQRSSQGHSWIAWDGKSKDRKAKCVTCGIMREGTGTGREYYRNGVKLDTLPPCNFKTK